MRSIAVDDAADVDDAVDVEHAVGVVDVVDVDDAVMQKILQKVNRNMLLPRTVCSLCLARRCKRTPLHSYWVQGCSYIT